ncbi:MAG: hypothetical protein J6Y82_06640 [Bacteroidales bacterium]|nr:hypothetical protein [Bacteroidales bacterium]
MKKILTSLLLGIALIMSNIPASAQYEYSPNQASAGIGLITHCDILEITSDIILTGFGVAEMKFGSDDEAGIAYNFQYNRRFTKHLSAGADFTYQRITNGVYPGWIEKSLSKEEKNEMVGKMKSHYLSLIPLAKLFWFDTKYVGMYSKLGLGITFLDREYDPCKAQYSHVEKNSNRHCFLGLQLSPIGIEVGRDMRGFLEFGYGTMGLINFGLEATF